jgi:CheY-like chemotaxis protein
VKHVLLIEDDEAIAEVVVQILHESGYAVDLVLSVADALAHVHANRPPAAVLLDLPLPETNGITFLRTCRASDRLASIPIVLLTGRPLPDLEDGLAPDAVLAKPFDIDRLCDVVDGLTQPSDGPSVVAATSDSMWSDHAR